MDVVGLVGPSGVGKTTLLVALVPILIARGCSVSTIKHAHCAFDIDRPGKDSFRHRAAGAQEVLVASAGRWALLSELRGEPEPSLEELIGRMRPVDILLVEGFKAHGHDKIALCRAGHSEAALWREDPHVIAVASDQPLPQARVPVLDLDAPGQIADFVLGRRSPLPYAAAAE